MKILSLVCAAILVLAGTSNQSRAEANGPAADTAIAPQISAEPSDPDATAAALALMDAIGAGKNFDNLLAKLKSHVVTNADTAAAKASTDAFTRLTEKFTGYKKQMTDETAALYAGKFSAAELRAVTEFYKSEAGKKFIAQMPNVMEEAGNIGQKFAVQMMKDLKAAKDAQ